MARTTIDIEGPILGDLKRLQKGTGKSLGTIVSELLAKALSRSTPGKDASSGFRWHARSMRARIDLADKEALRLALERKP